MTTPPQPYSNQPDEFTRTERESAPGTADSGTWTAPRHGGDYGTAPPVVPGPAQPYTLGQLMPGGPTPPPSPPADRAMAWTVLGAGVAIVLGSFLPWASITVPIGGTVTVSGVDGTDGWITAAVGGLVALYGFLALRRPWPAIVTVLAGIGGLGIAGLAGWKIIDLQSRIADLKAEMVADGDELGIAARMAEAVQARIGIGLWLLGAAGFVAAVAAGYSLVKRR